jgi:hypothetical protein
VPQDPWTFGVAAASLVVSAAALLLSWRSNRRSLRIQERQFELERSRRADELRGQGEAERASRQADVRCRITRHTAHSEQLLIWNGGEASAHDVTIVATEPELPYVQRDRDEKLPIPRLDPGDEQWLMLAFSMGKPRVADVTLQWQDASCRPGEVRQATHRVTAP